MFMLQTNHLTLQNSGCYILTLFNWDKWDIFKNVKGALSSLRHFLVHETSLKKMKNAFYFTSKTLFVLKILKFLSCPFGYVAKQG